MNYWLSALCTVFCILTLAPIGVLADDLPPFEGLVEPRDLVDFSSHVPGILEKVMVDRGNLVKKGQVLAQLKSGVEQAAVDLARARVEFNERKLERNQRLYQKQLMSVHHKDETQTEIQLAKLELAEAHERLKLRTIRSTIDGIVVERMGSPGEYVGEEPFLTVASIDPLTVELVVPVMYYGAIREGQTGKVELEEPVGGTFTAQVTMVDKVIDAASGTFGVRLELPNPDRKMPAGLKCIVTLQPL